MYVLAFTCVLTACSTSLIREPIAASAEWWEITLDGLTRGPDQYHTAAGYWRPRTGRCFIWATVTVRNRLKTAQKLDLGRVKLQAGGRLFRPFILDMGLPVTLRANPCPELSPGEAITRKLAYAVPEGVMPEKIMYGKAGIAIPPSAGK